MNSLHWRSTLHPALAAAMLLGLGIWLVVLYRRQQARHSTARAVALVLPKAIVAILVMLACFDPVWRMVRDPDASEKIAVLIDVSSSMGVRDEQEGARAARGAKLLNGFQDSLRSMVTCEIHEFDQEVRPYEGAPSDADETRDTDLGACLVTMANKPDASGYLGVVVITDGGDELVQNVRLPNTPVYITGVGSDPEGWDDIAVAELDAPAVVERESEFTVAAEVAVRRASPGFAPRSSAVHVALEEHTAEGWLVRSTQRIDLGQDRQRVELSVKSPAEQVICDYRLRVEPLAGEFSAMNNVRTFSVEVGKDRLPVLLFAQEVGWDFSTVRRELARDPSLALTTLFRISTDRFVIQDNRQEGDQVLDAGFPSDKAVLDLYKCVILGSFPASQWQAAQMQALLEYVRQGGAVIFLGGESSYAQGGYAGTAIEPLFPWRLDSAGGGLNTGQFAVNVPVAMANHRIVSEMVRSLAGQTGAMIESLNPTGSLRGGAVVLLEANAGARTMPVIALQRYGQGHSLAIASDTLWKWNRASESLSEALSHFWRQAVRNVSQWEEGERFLSVTWDQPHYRPGEQAVVKVGVAGRYGPGQVHLKATLSGGEPPRDVDMENVLGSENEFCARMVFPRRGEYVFTANAFVGEKMLESYVKTHRVGPTLNEGANLEVDHAFLDYLATQSGGAYFREADFDRLIETLRNRVVQQAVTMDVPLVQYNYLYIIIMLIVLAAEWTLRRRMNLF